MSNPKNVKELSKEALAKVSGGIKKYAASVTTSL